MGKLVLPHGMGMTEVREARRSRIAYLKALVARYRAGEFDPTPGLPVAKARERKRRRPRSDEKPTTEAVLREHSRLLLQDEKQLPEALQGSFSEADVQRMQTS